VRSSQFWSPFPDAVVIAYVVCGCVIQTAEAADDL